MDNLERLVAGYRARAGIKTEREFAKRLGVSCSFYSDIMSGKKGLSLRVIRLMAEELGLSEDERAELATAAAERLKACAEAGTFYRAQIDFSTLEVGEIGLIMTILIGAGE